ncbi:MAG: O-acetyl-ADP-ribose deacetylase (regulator of RNase III) [Paraglaciecola sp.]|jgi:O-acetyl-ADP-ribose deacetylase (regulator of RNase III)
MTAKITLLQDDISTLAVEAIVNAANPGLLGGGGVDGAIHHAAGEELLEACKVLGGCAVGEALITPGFKLPAKYVIHTVGPIWRGGEQGEAEQLASCYRGALDIARQQGIRTIAFPAISCGAYGFPIAQACHIAVNTVIEALAHESNIRKVIFCAFDPLVHEGLLVALGKTQLH